MKIIKVEDLKVGVCFSESLFIDPYNKLIDKEVPITEIIIENLKKWKIKEVVTEGYQLEEETIVVEKTEKTEPVSIYIATDSSIKSATEQKELEKQLEKEKKNKKLIKELNSQDIVPRIKIKNNIIILYNSAKELVKSSIMKIKEHRPVDKFALFDIVDRAFMALEQNKNDFLKLIFDEKKNNDMQYYLYTHMINTCILSLIMARALKLELQTRNNLGLGSLLHDVGMFLIPKEIVNKGSSLSEDEYDTVKQHPFLGYKVLMQMGELSENIANISLQHQELYDGSGYPKGLIKNEIFYLAQIVSLSSVFSALIQYRNYREKIAPYQAIMKILSVLKEKFNPKILNIFIRTIGIYPISTLVLLNNGYAGQVMNTNPEFPKQPKVILMYDEDGIPIKNDNIIDLSNNTNLVIERGLSKYEFEKMIVEKHEKLQR